MSGGSSATLAVVLVSGIAVTGTIAGYGPFLREAQNESLILLQGFVGVLSIAALLLDGTLKERALAWSDLSAARDDLELRVEQRTLQLTVANDDLNSVNLKLERANADLEQFAYVASHDLKAPLRAIGKLVEWIEEDLATHMSDVSCEHMRVLRGRIGRLEALLDGLLLFARTGRDETAVEWVDTQSLVREVVELLSPPDSIRIIVTDDLPSLTTARAPLQQVFQNLIGNALKHHDRDNGVIEVAGRDRGSYIEFSVADDGPGISENYHARIFQIFQTLKRRDEVEGSGIGLAVVDKLVRSFGGNIALKSKTGERGSTFLFTWEKSAPLAEHMDAA